MIRHSHFKFSLSSLLSMIDREGNPGAAFNTPRMAYGYVEADGAFFVAP